MTFRDAIAQGGTAKRRIALATHLGTDIDNETTSPTLTLSPIRRKAEARYAETYVGHRPPIAGYNCFGHAFALRRTAIYEIDRSLLATILEEDGYGEVADEAIEAGDIIVYFDHRGEPFHAGQIIRIDRLLTGSTATVPIVLSKLDDVSGEYEHRLDADVWPSMVASRAAYRARQRAPRRHGWRAVITSP
jgi:hypothetical protein